jgi:pyruvate dehydrogenase phosphatase
MYRFTLSLKARRLPVAAGVVAAFGSIWLTCKDQLYYSNSYGSLLWQYFVPSFLKTGSAPNIPGKQSSNPQSSRKLPHVEIRRNEKFVPVNFGVVSHYESNNLASNEPIEDRNAEYRVLDGLLFGVFDGHSGWQCAQEVMNRLPFYVAFSLASKHGIRDPKELDKIFSRVGQLEGTQVARKSAKDILGPKACEFVENGNLVNTGIDQQLRSAYSLLDNDIVYEALPEVNGYDHEKIMKGLSGACAITAYVQGNDLYVANSGKKLYGQP